MNDAASSSLPLDDNARNPRAASGHGDAQEVRWEVVAEMPGLLPARIVADRLRAEGIPARAWQESVGQAYGMVFGPLGTGFVSVPEEFFDAAMELLAEADEVDVDPDDSGDEF
ncbi:MAG TPA: hypothetical protein VE553_10930 [Candidatus Binatia bacterium]|nr:hypothetical protein [Candidatus Binatia bacterium]